MRDIPQSGVDLIKSNETDVLRVYDDRQPTVVLTADTKILGKLTGGYGHTGPDVIIGMEVTQAMADTWFKEDSLTKVVTPIYKKLGSIVEQLTDNQYGALCDFVYNLGTGNPLAPEWTIWKRLKAKEFDQVPQEMAKFVNWNGQKSIGLVKRRAAEQVLWSTDEPGTQAYTPPSSVTRDDPTPPTPADPVPPHRSAAFITGIAGCITAGPPMVNQAIQAIQPYSDQSDAIKHVLGTLAMIGGGLALASLGATYLIKRMARN